MPHLSEVLNPSGLCTENSPPPVKQPNPDLKTGSKREGGVFSSPIYRLSRAYYIGLNALESIVLAICVRLIYALES
jgi:hypothetical protein